MKQKMVLGGRNEGANSKPCDLLENTVKKKKGEAKKGGKSPRAN